MQMDIVGIHIPLTEGIKNHIDQRFTSTLQRFGQRVQDVLVRVSDHNGPRGGADKACKVHVQLVPTEHLIIEEVDTDLYAAIDRAAGRLKQAVARRFNKLPRMHHKAPQASGLPPAGA